MTLRLRNGRPVGLDWSVCNDENPQPEIWSDWRKPKQKKPKHRDIINPGSGRGSANRFSAEKDAIIVEMYTEQLMPAYKIADQINSTPRTIWRVLKRNNIQKRSKSNVQIIRHENKRRELS